MAFRITAVSGPDFVNRDKEMKELMAELGDVESCNGFALYGTRRVGKSSIFREMERRLGRKPNIAPIYFSMWDVAVKELPFFCRLMTRKVLEQYRSHLKIKYKIKDLYEASVSLLRQIIGGIRFSVPELGDSVEFVLTAGKDKDYDIDRLIEETFRLPDKLAQETNNKCVLFIDEFPDIMELKAHGEKMGPGVVGKIRGLCEEYTKTSLNISGSMRKTMDLAVLSKSSSFYRQLIVKKIEPFTDDVVEMLLKKNLSNKKIADEAVELIYKETAGIPLYVNYLGRIIKGFERNTIGEEDVVAATTTFVQQDARVLFAEDMGSLSDKERLVVIEMAVGKKKRHSEIDAALANQVSNVGMNIASLEQKGVLKRVARGHYAFEDPMFERWLEATYS